MDKMIIDDILMNRDIVFSDMEFRKDYDSIGAVYSIMVGDNLAIVSAKIDGIMPYIIDAELHELYVLSKKSRKGRQSKIGRENYADAIRLQYIEDSYYDPEVIREYGIPQDYDNHFNNELSVSYKVSVADIHG